MQFLDEQGLRQRLDGLGEAAVKRQLARHLLNPQEAAVAELWLDERAAARAERSSAGNLQLARSATNAAWAAAIAALVATAIAVAALIVSLLALKEAP